MTEEQPGLSAEIGRRTREHRSALGWTLDDLARASGVSRRMVVNVEQGTVNASIGTLLRLSDALGIGLPALVSAGRADSMTVVPHGTGAALWRSAAGGRAELLAGTSPPDVVELWEWTLAPGDRHESEAHRTGTREIAHVREGSVTIETLTTSVDLGVGDSLVFDTDVEHSYSNFGHARAVFTLVVFEPNVHPEEEQQP